MRRKAKAYESPYSYEDCWDIILPKWIANDCCLMRSLTSFSPFIFKRDVTAEWYRVFGQLSAKRRFRDVKSQHWHENNKSGYPDSSDSSGRRLFGRGPAPPPPIGSAQCTQTALLCCFRYTAATLSRHSNLDGSPRDGFQRQFCQWKTHQNYVLSFRNSYDFWRQTASQSWKNHDFFFFIK